MDRALQRGTRPGGDLGFPRAAAIVTDVGAPLSHAAIVARELGIPAIVGCGNASTRLHTGDRVLVDGGRGTVEILEELRTTFEDRMLQAELPGYEEYAQQVRYRLLPGVW